MNNFTNENSNLVGSVIYDKLFENHVLVQSIFGNVAYLLYDEPILGTATITGSRIRTIPSSDLSLERYQKSIIFKTADQIDTELYDLRVETQANKTKKSTVKKVTVFVPGKNRTAAVALTFSELFGGATVGSDCEGFWIDEPQHELIAEPIFPVYSYLIQGEFYDIHALIDTLCEKWRVDWEQACVLRTIEKVDARLI